MTVVKLSQRNLKSKKSQIDGFGDGDEQVSILHLTKTANVTFDDFARLWRDELFEQLDIGVMQNEVIIATDWTRIAGSNPLLVVQTGRPRECPGDWTFVISSIQFPHQTIAVGFSISLKRNLNYFLEEL